MVESQTDTLTASQGRIEPPTVDMHGFSPEVSSTTGAPLCRYCGKTYVPHDGRQEFCQTVCKRRWFKAWDSKGAALAKLLYAYRFERKPGALSALCHTFTIMVEEVDRKRKG